jgi:hypothetical protein
MAQASNIRYKGYVIRFSRGDWYVDDKDGKVVACVWSQKDGKRWVDSVLKEAAQRAPNPLRKRRGPPKGKVPPQLRRYLFKKGHR